MKDNKTEEIKGLIANKIKQVKGETSYEEISKNCNTTSARISNVANNRIDCRITTFIDIAIGLRVHPKELLNIDFDFDRYYADLDGE